MSKIIGVAGQAQMGKDTLADYLQIVLNEDGNIWSRSAFASNVKRIYRDTFNLDHEFIEAWKTKDGCPPGFDMSVRKSLQFIGDGFRKIQGTIWIDLIFRDKSAKILSDVRYVNEFLRINAEGGLTILVGRTEKVNNDPNLSESLIKPYVLWCLANIPGDFADLRKFDWHELRQQDHDVSFWTKIKRRLGLEKHHYVPDYIESIDFFVRNDKDVDSFLNVIKTKLSPMIKAYDFKD